MFILIMDILCFYGEYMFADVIVDIINDQVDKIFEYSIGELPVKAGSRVVVPFGSKVIDGIVMSVKETSKYPPEKIKPILRILEDTTALTGETLRLMNFVSDTCYCTRAAALRLFRPVEMRKGKVKEKFVRFIELNKNIDLNTELSSLNKGAKKQRLLG